MRASALPKRQEPHKQKKRSYHLRPSGELAGARTRDPNIKSVVLYLLSYEFIVQKEAYLVFGGANVGIIFIIPK